MGKKSIVTKGTIAVMEKVVVAWGSRRERAKVGIGVCSAEILRQDTRNDEAFAFELVDPTPPTQTIDLPGPSQPIP